MIECDEAEALRALGEQVASLREEVAHLREIALQTLDLVWGMADSKHGLGELLDAILNLSEGDSCSFSTAEIIAIAQRPEAVRLRSALAAVAGEHCNARKLGHFLRKYQGREVDGLILRRQDRDKAGRVWELAEAP